MKTLIVKPLKVIIVFIQLEMEHWITKFDYNLVILMFNIEDHNERFPFIIKELVWFIGFDFDIG